MKILGCEISELDSYAKTYALLIKYLRQGRLPSYISVNNVHTVTESLKDDYYRNIINNSFLSLPDGKPLSIIAKLKGINNINRIFGPEFFKKTLDWGQKDNISHFFFGSSEEILYKLEKNICKKFPRVKIAGIISPPFKDFTAEENKEFIELINSANPDLIWISLGAPKQEKWMFENYLKLNRGVMIGIGAGFDYLAGNLKEAPRWMKNSSLEWLYRLKQEPKRLWKRYFFSNSIFIYHIFLDFFGFKKTR